MTFESRTSSGAEGSSWVVRVRLDLTGDPLTEPVTVLVQDTTAGTASPGADLVAMLPAGVVFPVGSVDGDVQEVTVTTIDDSLIEGDETLELSLAVPSGSPGQVVGGKHELTLVDDDVATVQFTTDASILDEEGGQAALAIELLVTPGDVLGVDLSVRVVDTRSGSARRGTDYTFVDTVWTFPALSGATTQALPIVTPLDDSVYEGEETIVLELADLGAAGEMGPRDEHTITLRELDLSQLPLLEVYVGTGLDPVSSGDGLDLGSVQVGMQAAPLLLQIRNGGLTNLSMAAPVLTGDAGEIGLEALGTAQPMVVAPTRLAPLHLLDEDPTAGCVLEWRAEASGASRPAGVPLLLEGVSVPGGGQLDLSLAPLDSPLAADALILLNGEDVTAELGPELRALSLWSGSVVGSPDSSAFLAHTGDTLSGWIRLGDETLHLLPEPGGEDGATRVRVLEDAVMRSALTATPAVCQEALLPPTAARYASGGPSASAESLVLASTPTCRLAIETDHAFYQLFGSESEASAYVTGLVAAVSEVYEAEVQTTLEIAYLALYSTPADPWSTPEQSGNLRDYLDEFQAAWAPNKWPVQADLAHLLSGESLGGGIAFVDVLCDRSAGFGVSASLSGLIDWSQFNPVPAASNWDFIVVAHELGHGFGALHTQDYCPPLDHCASNCESTLACSDGTLMSYCQLCGNGLSNIQLGFHPQVANLLRSSVASSCLGLLELAGGETLNLDMTFTPTSAGQKSAALTFTHDAKNEPSPFQLVLVGTATN